jgi:hypothetical protein
VTIQTCMALKLCAPTQLHPRFQSETAGDLASLDVHVTRCSLQTKCMLLPNSDCIACGSYLSEICTTSFHANKTYIIHNLIVARSVRFKHLTHTR